MPNNHEIKNELLNATDAQLKQQLAIELANFKNALLQRKKLEEQSNRALKTETENREAAPALAELDEVIRRHKSQGSTKAYDQWITAMGNLLEIIRVFVKAFVKSHDSRNVLLSASDSVKNVLEAIGITPRIRTLKEKLPHKQPMLRFGLEINDDGKLFTDAYILSDEAPDAAKKIFDIGLVLWLKQQGYRLNNQSQFVDLNNEVLTADIFDRRDLRQKFEAHIKKELQVDLEEYTPESPLSLKCN